MIPASTLHLVAVLIGALALVTLALAVFLPQAAAARQLPGHNAHRLHCSNVEPS